MWRKLIILHKYQKYGKIDHEKLLSIVCLKISIFANTFRFDFFQLNIEKLITILKNKKYGKIDHEKLL